MNSLTLPVKPKIVPQRAKAMTIAAGFRCHNGVVLCADTQITNPDGTKTYRRKLRPINPAQECWLVYAGDVGFSGELVDEIATRSVGSQGIGLVDSIKKTYRDFLNQFSANPHESLRTWADIIFTIRQGDEMLLYASDGGMNIRPETRYVLKGDGAPFADVLFQQYFDRALHVQQVASLAIYALKAAKAVAGGCGGDSHVLKLRDDSSSRRELLMPEKEVEKIEKDLEFFQNSVCGMLLDFPGVESADDYRFKSSFAFLKKNLSSYKGRKKKAKTTKSL